MTIRNFISRHRRSRLFRMVADRCARFLRCYENADGHDFDTNGERFVLQALAKHEFKVILDIGANVGNWALMAHEIFPTSKIHCFEIMRSTCEQLSERTRGIDQITANECGLAETEAEVYIHHYPDMPVLSTVTEYPHEADHVKETGQVITGDSYLLRNGMDHVNFAKIDVEGAESSVLKGLGGAIAEKRIDVIQFEYGQVSVITKFMLRDFYTFFSQFGYVVGKIYPTYVEFRDYDFRYEDFYGCNYLAVREERKELIAALS